MKAMAHWSKQGGWMQVVVIQLCVEGKRLMEIAAHTEHQAGMLRKIHS
jgi:hypothetical protein